MNPKTDGMDRYEVWGTVRSVLAMGWAGRLNTERNDCLGGGEMRVRAGVNALAMEIRPPRTLFFRPTCRWVCQ